ncbi:MAG TPA: DUF1365 domain-containing protein [Gammaproteobacteria bacterium]|nr:DUF1365 domain-containing protein [Gammaproteobacteria bacterium]
MHPLLPVDGRSDAGPVPAISKPEPGAALYRGWLRHRRHLPRAHVFQQSLYLAWLDLDRLDEDFRGLWLWSHRRIAPLSFRRRDHLGRPSEPLAEAVRSHVQTALGHRPLGPVRLLTHLACLGYRFNPVSFFYCYDSADSRLEAIVAEITNTPWGERCTYTLDCRSGHDDRLRFRFAKDFHVSPFMPMDLDYDWRFGVPGRRLWVQMVSLNEGSRVFDATLSLERLPWDATSRREVLLRHPLMSLEVIAGIYFQAARLWWKRTPFFAHPRERPVTKVP